MTPKEIAEYIYSEFTPLSKMTQEEAKLHVEQLIIDSLKEGISFPAGLRPGEEIKVSRYFIQPYEINTVCKDRLDELNKLVAEKRDLEYKIAKVKLRL